MPGSCDTSKYLSLRVVISAFVAILLAGVAFLTFFLVYEVSLTSLRELGLDHALLAARRTGNAIEGAFNASTDVLLQFQTTVHDGTLPGMRFAFPDDYAVLGYAKDLPALVGVSDAQRDLLAEQLATTTAADVDTTVLRQLLAAEKRYGWHAPWLAATQGLRFIAQTGTSLFCFRLLDYSYAIIGVSSDVNIMTIGRSQFNASSPAFETPYDVRTIATFLNGSDVAGAFPVADITMPEEIRTDSDLMQVLLPMFAKGFLDAGGFNLKISEYPRGYFVQQMFQMYQYPDGTVRPSAGIPAAVPLFNASNVLLGVAAFAVNSDYLGRTLEGDRPTANSQMFVLDGSGLVAASTVGEVYNVIPVPTSGAVPTNCFVDSVGKKVMGCRYMYNVFPGYAPLALPTNSFLLTSERAAGARFAGGDGETYYVGTVRLVNDLSSFSYWVVSVIPEGDVLGSVRRQRNVNVGIVLGFFAAAALLAFVLVYRVLLPLQVIARRMRYAADFVDEIDPADSVSGAGRSGLSEVAALQDAFGEMDEQLKALKSFVPQAVLLQRRRAHQRDLSDPGFDDHHPADGEDGHDDEVEEAEDVAENGTSMRLFDVSAQGDASFVASYNGETSAIGAPRASPLGPPDRQQVNTACNKHQKGNAGRRGGGGRGGVAAAGTIASGSTPDSGHRLVTLQQRNVSVVHANFLNLHAILGLTSNQHTYADQTRHVVELLTTAVLREAQLARGVLDAFHGDHFTITFNCVAPCAMHVSRAAAAALAIGRRVQALLRERDEAALVSVNAGAPPLSSVSLVNDATSASGLMPPPGLFAPVGSGSFRFALVMGEQNAGARLRLNAGLASGFARLGDLGCADAKRFMTIGAVVPTAAALERAVRRHPREEQWTPTPDDAHRVAISAALMEELRTGFMCECVDVALLPFVPSRVDAALAGLLRNLPLDARLVHATAARAVPHAIAQVVDERRGTGRGVKDHDEWMYVVGDGTSAVGAATVKAKMPPIQADLSSDATAGAAASMQIDAPMERSLLSSVVDAIGDLALLRWKASILKSVIAMTTHAPAARATAGVAAIGAPHNNLFHKSAASELVIFNSHLTVPPTVPRGSSSAAAAAAAAATTSASVDGRDWCPLAGGATSGTWDPPASPLRGQIFSPNTTRDLALIDATSHSEVNASTSDAPTTTGASPRGCNAGSDDAIMVSKLHPSPLAAPTSHLLEVPPLPGIAVRTAHAPAEVAFASTQEQLTSAHLEVRRRITALQRGTDYMAVAESLLLQWACQ